MRSVLFFLLFAASFTIAAQTPIYDELNIDSDEMETTYRPAGKNYVFLRSKRGTGGLVKTSSADSVKSFSIKEILLVFTEVNESAFDEREDANKERWENLLKTYPEFFKTGTTYKSVCQCKIGGDSVSFKKAQGFYVYYKGTETAVTKVAVADKKVEEKKVEEKKVEEKKVEEKVAEKKAEKKVEEKKVEEKKEEKVAEKKVEEKKVEEKKVEEKVAEKKVEEKVEPEPVATDESTGSGTEIKESDFKKKVGYSKPKRAKDKKACRPACYATGVDDLNTFLKDNISLTKKQKKHGKNLVAFLKLQLNFDGSIKKAMVTGEDSDFNKLVTDAAKQMNLWNPAVRNGVTIKSEVKLTLKYNKGTKSIIADEIAYIPRPAPKCITCISDAEMFGE